MDAGWPQCGIQSAVVDLVGTATSLAAAACKGLRYFSARNKVVVVAKVSRGSVSRAAPRVPWTNLHETWVRFLLTSKETQEGTYKTNRYVSIFTPNFNMSC